MLSAAFMCMALNSNAQISGIGIQPKMQFSTQTYHNPEKPKDGVSAEQDLSSFGIDAYFDYRFNDKWKLRIKSGVEKKGYENRYHNGLSDDKVIDQYVFKYTSLDVQTVYDIRTFGHFTPTLSLGLSSGYLYDRPENSYEYEIFGEPFEHYDDFSSFSLGSTLGLGFHFDDIIWVDLEWNRDLFGIVKRPDLVKRNRTYSINVGINILKILQETKK